ncbi:MAG: hypothetical protein KDI51_03940 [Xanthomonadales bacterium]|nr:hypothetical protein [Xanthomonadales bacterium]
MALDESGATLNGDLLALYYSLLQDDSERQNALLVCETRAEFKRKLLQLGRFSGLKFSSDELDETFSGNEGSWSEDRLMESGIKHKWIQKIMYMGWAPAGFSR